MKNKLKYLKTGHRLFCKIVEIKSEELNTYVVNLDGEHLIALSSVRFNKGDNAYLEVIKEGNPPQLRLVSTEEKREPTEAEKLAKMLRIPQTEENISLLTRYLDEKRPVQLDAVMEFIKNNRSK